MDGEFAAVTAAAAAQPGGSYRVKFRRETFLMLMQMAKPKIIYRRGNMHFFSHDGFVVYTSQCQDNDFGQKIFEAIEFSNQSWQK